ncbi:MAG: hypothetical protein JSV34_02065 [Candidatus Omnitrophota bacterium]|nr:MAG: hypothetical protein JSV34_02065 [Candidatus Omnitrophota bacterium]
MKKSFIKLKTVLIICLIAFPLVVSAADYVIDPSSYDHTQIVLSPAPKIALLGDSPPLNTPLRDLEIAFIERTDRQGNTVLYINGKPVWKKEQNGDTFFYINGQISHKVAVSGIRILNYKWNNKGIATLRNEADEIIGYEQHGLGGKILMRFDSKYNLTHIYDYDKDDKGYWVFNLPTKVWTRYEFGKPTVETFGKKGGHILAYWLEEADGLWRIEYASIIVKDAQGNTVYGDDGFPLRQYGIAKKERFNKHGTQILQEYDANDNLRVSYEWENHRLKRVVNHYNNTYKKYSDFGVVEEGAFGRQGEEVASWVYDWQGSRMKKAYELLSPDGSGIVCYSGKYISFSADGKIEEVAWRVNEHNQPWFNEFCEELEIPAYQIGDEIIQEDYAYFYEVKNLNEEQLADFFHTSKDTAAYIYSFIEDMKAKGKADAAIFARAIYGMPKSEIYLERFVGFDEASNERLSVYVGDEANYDIPARLFKAAAQRYLENGDYADALKSCAEFKDYYERDLADIENLDDRLARLYLKVLNIERQAQKKLGKFEEADDIISFIVDNFSGLVNRWGQEYVELVEQVS